MNIFDLHKMAANISSLEEDWEKRWREHIVRVLELSFPRGRAGQYSPKTSLIALDAADPHTLTAQFVNENTRYKLVVQELDNGSIISSLYNISYETISSENTISLERLIKPYDIVQIVQSAIDEDRRDGDTEQYPSDQPDLTPDSRSVLKNFGRIFDILREAVLLSKKM